MDEQVKDRTMDPAEMSRLYAEIAKKSSDLISGFIDRREKATRGMPEDEMGIARAFFDAWAGMLADPVKLAEAQMKFWNDTLSLWQNSMMRMFGQPADSVAEPGKGDRRFRHEDWQNNFVYDYIKQSYLIAARHMHENLVGAKGLDDQAKRKVDFYTRQYIDALSPSNFVLTNPEVVRETVATGGQNLLKGLNNLLEDLKRGNGSQLRVRMTDDRVFKLGENIAVTPGKVVYQNELMQLIQFDPVTPQVYKRPILIVPPWINKYYILDLRQHNSFVKWAVEHGHTVFVISWANPDEKHVLCTFEDYLNEGPIAALDAIGKATGVDEVNMVGFCLGGTLQAATLGYLAAKKDRRVKSATFFATLIDFTHPGELGVFIDEQQVAALEKRMNKRGYLEGTDMATTFNMLRANDLIWSFVVNNYLMGKDPFPFDLLYWNSDSTRMPAAMHSYYLRKMYLENRLTKPDGIVLNDTPVDLGKASLPVYFVSTVEDHIAPWKSTYAGAQLFPGPVRFVLAGSGHIAGIINPPSANKYGFWTNDKLADTPEAWFEGAKQHAGSWWTDWTAWAARQGGPKVAARVPGKGKLKVIEAAPGSYVRLRIDARKPA